MIVKKLNSPMIISRNLRFIILGDVIFYKQTIIIFFFIQKVHGWKDRRSVVGHFSAKNISFKNGIFPFIHCIKIPKVHGWKDRRSVVGHFSAKNISFENGIFRIFPFIPVNPKSPWLEGPNVSGRTLFSQKYFV